MPVTFPTELVEKISDDLKKLPAPDRKKTHLTKKEAVLFLAKEIEALRKKGYTVPEIAAILTERGLPVSKTTLQGYFPSRSRAANRSSRPASQPQKDSPSQGDEQQPSASEAKPAAKSPAQNRASDTAPQASASFRPKPDTDDI